MAFGESWLISVMMRFSSNGMRVMNESPPARKPRSPKSIA
jgi:hypothetical protein